MDFVYIKLPRLRSSPEREHEVHAALESALAGQALGSLVGWGTSVEPATRGGTSLPEFHRIDIEVADVQAALPTLKATLAALDIPPRSELHYTVEGEALQEEFGRDGWGSSHPTTATTAHRGRPRK